MGELVARYYEDLRAIAASKRLRLNFREASPTSIVSGATVRMLGQRSLPQSKDHFLALATTIMSRYVLDELRKRRSMKRDGSAAGPRPHECQDWRGSDAPATGEATMHAMARMSEIYPRQAEALSLHAMCNVPMSKVAELLGVSVPTAERDVRFARAWIIAQRREGSEP